MRRLILLVLFFCFCSTPILADEIYKWVDEKGVVHFSDSPSGNANSQKTVVPDIERTPAPELATPSPAPTPYSTPLSGQAAPAGTIDQNKIRLEMRRLDEREQLLTTKLNAADSATTPGFLGIDHRAIYQRKLDELEQDKQLLLQDPEYYFYRLEDKQEKAAIKLEEKQEEAAIKKEKQKKLDRRPRTYVNPQTGEFLHENGNGHAFDDHGNHYIRSGNRFLNTSTGEYIEAH